MPETITIPLNDEHSIAGIHNKPAERSLAELDRKLIIMIHGFPGHKAGHSDLYADLEYILVDKGFHTLRFDFIGCGNSSGEQEDFSLSLAKECLNAIKKWAKNNSYKELSFISEGLGSTIAMLNMELNLSCQVMLWPGFDPQYLAKTIFKSETITDKDKKVGHVVQDHNRIGIPFIHELQKTNLKPFFKDVVMPVLIIHGSADDRYPVEHLNIARNELVSKRIEITTFHEADHGLPELDHRKSMFFHITQFLEKFA